MLLEDTVFLEWGDEFEKCLIKCMDNKQGYALKNWVEGLFDEAFYPLESPKKIRLKLVNPTFATEQKKVSIHQ